MKTSTHV